jgi:hypothetical protein
MTIVAQAAWTEALRYLYAISRASDAVLEVSLIGLAAALVVAVIRLRGVERRLPRHRTQGVDS